MAVNDQDPELCRKRVNFDKLTPIFPNERFVLEDFTVTHNCTNIYSTEFIVETYDVDNKKLT